MNNDKGLRAIISHTPDLLPPEIDYGAFVQEMGGAHHALGALQGALRSPVINPQLLVSPLLTREAVSSSRIEGTQATLRDVLKYEASPDDVGGSSQSDILEVINYRHAVDEAMTELETRPISENLIKNAHRRLLNSVRGENRAPGEFRRARVHIGPLNSRIEDALYVPPTPDNIAGLFADWEQFINEEDPKDPLVQIAVAHYQFEAIHPFMDGNGRIGRLLIPLYLCERKLLSHPLLYMSGYFEKHRGEYYERLRGVDREKNWVSWIKYFLLAVQSQALTTQIQINDIQKLYADLKADLPKMRSVFAANLLDIAFVSPFVSYRGLKDRLTASPQTIYNLLAKFVDAGILHEVGSAERNRVFAFDRLLDLLDPNT